MNKCQLTPELCTRTKKIQVSEKTKIWAKVQRTLCEFMEISNNIENNMLEYSSIWPEP